MSLPINIRDGRGRGNLVKINGEGEMSVVVHPHPPRDEEVSALPFSQNFVDSNSSSLMNVDGSVTPVEFSIESNQDYDIYIKTIQIQLGDNGTVTLSKFGALAALTNGLEFYYSSNETGTLLIDTIKSNLEFMKLATGKDDFGTGTDVFRADVSGAGENTYMPEIDFALRFGLPWGLRIIKGTTAKIVFKVSDDLSTIATFNIKGYGIRL